MAVIGNRRQMDGPWDATQRSRLTRISSKVLYDDGDSNGRYHEYGRDYKGYSQLSAINTNCIDGPYFLKPHGAGVFWRNELWI